jgi:hypothetical protein
MFHQAPSKLYGNFDGLNLMDFDEYQMTPKLHEI